MARARKQRPSAGGRTPYRGPGHRDAPPTLGVDVGGVIVDRVAAGEDTSFFGSQPLLTSAVEGVFDALALLVAEPFAGRVYLVSKAGPKVAANTRVTPARRHPRAPRSRAVPSTTSAGAYPLLPRPRDPRGRRSRTAAGRPIEARTADGSPAHTSTVHPLLASCLMR